MLEIGDVHSLSGVLALGPSNHLIAVGTNENHPPPPNESVAKWCRRSQLVHLSLHIISAVPEACLGVDQLVIYTVLAITSESSFHVPSFSISPPAKS